ncbi:hypothetical protein [Chitinophaga flava]|uniref:DUF4402 domain-containing protein n=1 Tax=Chitinophaga flava TaxID=2259036 RepID=A0A365Y2C9_9BACT|nr:hypothetical protein [Chitinophaga flava]RBL92762.1 hypothetical protein DF182_09345 [Chitinophaga flava]
MKKTLLLTILSLLAVGSLFAQQSTAVQLRDSKTFRVFKADPVLGTVISIDCGSAVVRQGDAPFKNGVANMNVWYIPYVGDVAGAIPAADAGPIASQGVEGLQLVLLDGNITSGTWAETVGIWGTPTSSGTASFPIHFGGQSCTLSVTVQP